MGYTTVREAPFTNTFSLLSFPLSLLSAQGVATLVTAKRFDPNGHSPFAHASGSFNRVTANKYCLNVLKC